MSRNASRSRSFSASSSSTLVSAVSTATAMVTPPSASVQILFNRCDGDRSTTSCGVLAMGRVVAVLVVCVFMLTACGGNPEPDGNAAYCAVVVRTEAAMAGTDPATKRPAMAELRDAAPAEIRSDWDTVFEVEPMDPTTRELAQERIDRFNAEHC